MKKFDHYNDWHTAITVKCGLNLTQEYCAERIASLQDDNISTTKSFIETYGSTYRDQVIEWFKLAQNIAIE
jgi:hypothetical protein